MLALNFGGEPVGVSLWLWVSTVDVDAVILYF